MTSEALPLPGIAGRGLRQLLGARPVRVAIAALGTVALAALIVPALRMVTAAGADPQVLVPSSHLGFPAWMAGPFPSGRPVTIHGLSQLLVLMSVLYLVVLACSRALP